MNVHYPFPPGYGQGKHFVPYLPQIPPMQIPAEARFLQRFPPGVVHGFPHPGFMGSNAGLEPGRDNPFWRGGPAGGSSMPPLDPFGGVAGSSGDPPLTAEQNADYWSPLDRTSVIGLSGDLAPNTQQELARVFTKSQIGARGIAFHWSIRPGLGFNFAADTLDVRLVITFGSGGAQMAPVVPDLGCGSLPNDGATIPEPGGVGGFGGSVIIPGSFAKVVAMNVGASPAGNLTTIAVMATISETIRNPQPVYTTLRATLTAAGGATDTATFAIPPYSSHLQLYRTNSGTNAIFVQILRYVGGVTSTYDLTVPAGTQMNEVTLPNGSSRVNVINMGPNASNVNAMFRLNI